MSIRTRPGRTLLAMTIALTIPLSGCFGPSNDKGDTRAPLVTPKPSTVEDANTAGDRTTPLPIPENTKPQAGNPTDAGPK